MNEENKMIDSTNVDTSTVSQPAAPVTTPSAVSSNDASASTTDTTIAASTPTPAQTSVGVPVVPPTTYTAPATSAANTYGYKPYSTTPQQPSPVTPAYSTYQTNNTQYGSYPQTTTTTSTATPATPQYGNSAQPSYPYTPVGQQYTAPPKKSKGGKLGLVVICIILSLVSGMIGSMIELGQNNIEQPAIEVPFNGNPWADVSEFLLNSTVWIYADDAVYVWTGSGVVISSDGYILTNHHVAYGARNIEVYFYGGDSHSAELIATDERNDLALIKIDVPGLSAVRLGNAESVRVGDEVLGIGNQLGEFPDTVTNGIISHLPERIPYSGYNPNCFQTNVAIMPGNSGGGLFNHQGDLIGINNASWYQLVELADGRLVTPMISYAITIDQAIELVRDILGDDYISDDATLDIKITSVSDKNEAKNSGYSNVGVYITEVGDYGPAYFAGLKEDDRIVKIGNNVISTDSDYNNAINNHRVGDYIKVTIERGGQQYVYTIQLSRELAG